jgi:hypothetical protein
VDVPAHGQGRRPGAQSGTDDGTAGLVMSVAGRAFVQDEHVRFRGERGVEAGELGLFGAAAEPVRVADDAADAGESRAARVDRGAVQ